MKNMKKWIEILKTAETCGVCGSDEVYPVITPHPLFIHFEHAQEENTRGIRIGCFYCHSTRFITAKELEE